ncbi:uncharacterized protein FIBRA_01784 [Fibroporia radiculosa]|uniref:Uncharacterized protein n=1 Tax=Fibroporia radiculosa TaxID=599839 RepID=J4HTW2_9APHY|nr:uncharacterized protein FIBRA_01784 [Fibroporia radiculosa]CCL99762.1 predicted protein [Fibroporia radiculosa]
MYSWCNLPASVLNNNTLQAQQCTSGTVLPGETCTICPNTDIAGVGVRAAFYVQSLFNTLLVIFSPEDSVPSAWASTLLTAALVIAAVVQKIQGSITLHHSILVLNYATLSCISSLAIAPILPVWRIESGDPVARGIKRGREHVQSQGDDTESITNMLLNTNVYTKTRRRYIRMSQEKQRTVLALALFLQVILQWSWGILMFVSPSYSQKACSADTVLLFFFVPLTAQHINDGRFYVWALWLLLSLGVTLFLTVILAISSRTRARKALSRHSTISSISSTSSPFYQQLYHTTMASMPPLKDPRRQSIFWGNVLFASFWILLIIASELQIRMNCIFSGENYFGGFGQITATFLAFTPIWSLTVALYRYPAELRKQRRRELAARTSSLRHPSPAAVSRIEVFPHRVHAAKVDDGHL